MLQYASGLPIHVPVSNSNLYPLLFQTTFANKASSNSYFLKRLNDKSVDPLSEFVLNPSAWTDPEEGQFTTSSAYYKTIGSNTVPRNKSVSDGLFRSTTSFG